MKLDKIPLSSLQITNHLICKKFYDQIIVSTINYLIKLSYIKK